MLHVYWKKQKKVTELTPVILHSTFSVVYTATGASTQQFCLVIYTSDW